MSTKYLRDANGNYLRDANGKLLTVSSSGGFVPTYMDIGMGIEDMSIDESGITYWSNGNELSDDYGTIYDCSQNTKLPITAGAGVKFVKEENNTVSINTTQFPVRFTMNAGETLGDYLDYTKVYYLMADVWHNPYFPDDENGNQNMTIYSGLYDAIFYNSVAHFRPFGSNGKTYNLYSNHAFDEVEGYNIPSIKFRGICMGNR